MSIALLASTPTPLLRAFSFLALGDKPCSGSEPLFGLCVAVPASWTSTSSFCGLFLSEFLALSIALS